MILLVMLCCVGLSTYFAEKPDWSNDTPVQENRMAIDDIGAENNLECMPLDPESPDSVIVCVPET